MKAFIEKIGGRKMLLSLLVFIVSTLLVYFTKLDQDSYFSLVKYLVLSYLGGNVAQTAFVKKSTDAKVAFAEDIVETITQGQSLNDMGGRKFLFVIGVYITTTILMVLKVLESAVYIDIVNWVVFIYIGANVAGKAVANGVTVSLGKQE